MECSDQVEWVLIYHCTQSALGVWPHIDQNLLSNVICVVLSFAQSEGQSQIPLLSALMGTGRDELTLDLLVDPSRPGVRHDGQTFAADSAMRAELGRSEDREIDG